jgi:prepilin-type processing-associated H-X9-DG protein
MSHESRKFAFLFCTLLTAVHTGAAASLAAPTDLADVVPEGALIYIGRPGSDHTDAALKGTALGEMLADAEIKRFHKHLRQVIDHFLLREIGDDENDLDAYKAGKELLTILARRPSAFALLDGGVGEQGPFMQAALLCLLGDAEKAFSRHLDAFLEATETAGQDVVSIAEKPMRRLNLMAPFPIYYGVIDNHFILAVGEGVVEQLVEGLQGTTGSLAANKRLLVARKKMAGDARTRTLTVYANVTGLMERAKQILPIVLRGNTEQVQQVMKILSAVGLDSLQSITWENHLTKRGCYSGMYFYAPDGSGLFSTQSSKPLTDSDLAVIPKSPSWAAAYNIDVAAIYRGILSAVEAFDADIYADIAEGIQDIEEVLGFRIDQDFLQLIGDTIIIFDAPENGGLLFTGITKLVESSNPKLLQERLRQIVQAIGKEVGEETVRLSSLDHRGHLVQFVNVVGVPMPLAPAWTTHEKWVIFGLYPQMVTTTLDRLMDGDPKKDSILANSDFAAARKVMGDWGWSASYMDSKAAMENLYPFVLLLAQIGAAMAQGEGIQVDISAFPTLKAVTRHLFADVNTARSDANGTLYASYGPLPFAPDPIMSSNLGTTALLTSIMLPSLSRARELSKRTVCMSNMRGLGTAMYIYAHEDSKFPDDLGALIEANIATEKQFVCPSTTAQVGSGLDACYIYIPGQGLASQPRNVVLYEKRGNHSDDGGNVLFQDSHVEWITPYSRVEELVAETKERLARKKKQENEEL